MPREIVNISEITVEEWMSKIATQKIITTNDIDVFLRAVNDNSMVSFVYSGVMSECGKVCYGSADGAIMSWCEFMNSKIKLRNVREY